MTVLILYPAVAALAMFIICTIIIILKYGPQLCGLRHHALRDDNDWNERAYDQQISYA